MDTSTMQEPTPVVPIEPKRELSTKTIVIVIYIILVLLGIGTGFLLSRTSSKTTMINTKNEVGVSDTKTFRDSAEGVLEKDGVEGEGTHRLIREGGPSQTAYLTSSVVDMDQFVGKKVRVWGETFAAEKVNWLMDVGKIELLE